jgi:uncharacterized protein YjbI with pentapeptide repeats
MGLETRPPAADGSEPAFTDSSTDSPALDLPPIAAKDEELEAIKKAVDDAASVGGGLWLSYLFVLFYLAVAAGAVTHEDLFFERSVKLPFLNIELPLLAFFLLAPILFIIVHAYTLVHLVMLTEKAKRYNLALHDPARGVTGAAREDLQWQLPSNIFVQFLAGPSDVRSGLFGWALRAITWTTLVVAPIFLLLLLQIQFLPFHNGFVTWTHRFALLADLVLLWWLWRKILLEPRPQRGRQASGLWPVFAFSRSAVAVLFIYLLVVLAGEPFWLALGLSLSAAGVLFSWIFATFRGERRLWATIGFSLSTVAVLFSWTLATFPGEWQEKEGPVWVSLHDWLFESGVDEATRRRFFPFSSTLVLPGLNIFEGLGIDDPDKAKWHDYVFRARGRDLRGAILTFASLAKVDFEGADLRGASLRSAQLQGASFDRAQLQGASLRRAQLQGASLNSARLQGALLDDTHLQDASLREAQLQGASFDRAELQGASLHSAQLQGAKLDDAQLQYAQLDYAHLQGASFEDANLNGTGLEYAELDGARLTSQQLQNVELYDVVIHGVLPSEMTEARRYPSETRAQNDADYAKALAAELKTLVCSGSKKTDDILRGLLRGTTGELLLSPESINSRLAETGAEAPALVDFIMSDGCPVAAPLTNDYRLILLDIKRQAEKAAK